MKIFVCSIAILLAHVISSDGDVPSGDFQVVSNGVICGSSSQGRITWTGTVSIKHPRFQIGIDGQTTLFSGPSVRCKQGGGEALRAENLTFNHEWISLVALGDITITVIYPGGTSRPITARRFVYIPGKDQILIDGKLWKAPTRIADPVSPGSDEGTRQTSTEPVPQSLHNTGAKTTSQDRLR